MRLRNFFIYLVIGSLAVILFTTLAPEAKADSALNKVGRGLKNIVIAPIEIPVSMASEAKKNPFLGLLLGPVVGTVNCATRTVAGVVELITSPVPPYDQPLYDRMLGETIWE